MMAVLLRVLKIVGGYFLAVLAAIVALPVLFALLSALTPNPGVWIIAASSPIFVISLPFLLPFAYLLAVVVTVLPAVIAVVATEFFSLRMAIWYCLFGALVAAGGYLQVSPRMIFGLGITGAIEIVVFAIAGMAGGMAYWSIAGRSAGGWRRQIV